MGSHLSPAHHPAAPTAREEPGRGASVSAGSRRAPGTGLDDAAQGCAGRRETTAGGTPPHLHRVGAAPCRGPMLSSRKLGAPRPRLLGGTRSPFLFRRPHLPHLLAAGGDHW